LNNVAQNAPTPTPDACPVITVVFPSVVVTAVCVPEKYNFPIEPSIIMKNIIIIHTTMVLSFIITLCMSASVAPKNLYAINRNIMNMNISIIHGDIVFMTCTTIVDMLTDSASAIAIMLFNDLLSPNSFVKDSTPTTNA